MRFLTTGAKFLAGMRSAPTFLGVGLFWPGRGCALAGATAPKATPAAPVCPTIDCQPEPRSVLKQTTSGCCTIRLRMNETEIKPGRENQSNLRKLNLKRGIVGAGVVRCNLLWKVHVQGSVANVNKMYKL